MAAFYHRTTGRERIFGLLALAMSILYAPFCTGTYVLIFWCVVFVPIALLFMKHFRPESERSVLA